MAFDAFLKLTPASGTPVAGESTDAVHKGEIQILGYNFSTSHPTTVGSATGGAGAGKATFADFSFSMNESKASPVIFQASAAGTRFSQAVVSLRRSGATGKAAAVDFVKITMAPVFVTSFSSGGSSGDDLPHDEVRLSYGSLKLQYTPESAAGAAGAPVSGGWDVQKNAPA